MEKTKSYSGLFIINPEKEETIDDCIKALRSIISGNAGKIVEERNVGKKTLTYPVKKKKEGIYLEIVFTAKPSAVEKITRLCNINTDILRTLINNVG